MFSHFVLHSDRPQGKTLINMEIPVGNKCLIVAGVLSFKEE